ncbi:MAG: hypothetical protein KJO83_02415 [Bacteroidia bacterium]|nr:hypothetical protein [Bacteroidia bacterium]
MAFENLKENLSGIDANVRSFIENNREYYQLKGFKILMKGTTTFAKILLIGSVLFLALLLFSLAVSYGVGQALDNMFYGFLIVGVFYLVLGFIVYLFKDKLDKPILKMFSKYYYDEDENS